MTGVIKPAIVISKVAPLAALALENVVLATLDRIEAELDPILKKLNHFKSKNVLLVKLILKKDVAMNNISIRLIEMKEKVATVKQRKGYWQNLTHIFFLLEFMMELSVPACEKLSLKLSLPYIWDSLVTLR